jgi:hypothetical protein
MGTSYHSSSPQQDKNTYISCLNLSFHVLFRLHRIFGKTNSPICKNG